MDVNGGVDPATQGNGSVPQFVPPQPQMQQAPMAAQNVAFTAPPAGGGTVAPQAFAAAANQASQDPRPDWQQELQYVAPEVAAQSPHVQPAPPQTPIPDSAYSLLLDDSPALNTQAAPAKPKNKVLVAGLILIAIMAVGAIAAAAYMTGVKKGVTEATAAMQQEASQQQQSEQSNEANNVEEPKKDEAERIEFQTSKPQYIDEVKDGAVNEVVQSSDGFVLKVLSIERKYQPGSSSNATKRSGELVRINLIVGNADTTRAKIIKPETFIVADASGEIAGTLVTDVEYEGQATLPLTIESGDQAQFSLLYELTGSSDSLQFIRNQPYTVGGENKLMVTVIPFNS